MTDGDLDALVAASAAGALTLPDMQTIERDLASIMPLVGSEQLPLLLPGNNAEAAQMVHYATRESRRETRPGAAMYVSAERDTTLPRYDLLQMLQMHKLPPLEIVNVVSKFTTGVRLTDGYAAHAISADYTERSTNFRHTFRINDRNVFATFYANGTCVVAGTRSDTESREACAVIVAYMNRQGIPFRYENFEKLNIVAKAALPFRVDLHAVHNRYRLHTAYNPQTFPGVVFKIHKPNVNFLIFESKIVMMGPRTIEELYLFYPYMVTTVLAKTQLARPMPAPGPAARASDEQFANDFISGLVTNGAMPAECGDAMRSTLTGVL